MQYSPDPHPAASFLLSVSVYCPFTFALQYRPSRRSAPFCNTPPTLIPLPASRRRSASTAPLLLPCNTALPASQCLFAILPTLPFTFTLQYHPSHLLPAVGECPFAICPTCHLLLPCNTAPPSLSLISTLLQYHLAISSHCALLQHRHPSYASGHLAAPPFLIPTSVRSCNTAAIPHTCRAILQYHPSSFPLQYDLDIALPSLFSTEALLQCHFLSFPCQGHLAIHATPPCHHPFPLSGNLARLSFYQRWGHLATLLASSSPCCYVAAAPLHTSHQCCLSHLCTF